MRRRILFIAFFVIIVFLVIVIPTACSFLITNMTFRFPERGVQQPEEAGLPVEDVEFESSDGIVLRGWWNSGEADAPVIIFAHGLNRSRVELLERASEARSRGYGVLLFDFRNHGQSGEAYTTLGLHEIRDVCAASHVAAERAPGRPQMLWGVSMGAATALLAAAECPGFAGIVSDSAFISFRETVGDHLQLYFHIPRFPVANLIVAITGLRMGVDPDEGDVEAAVRNLGDTPVLFIAGSEDRRMSPDVARRLFEAAGSPAKQLLIVQGAGHGEAFRTRRQQYLDRVFQFLGGIHEFEHNNPN